MNEVLNHVPAEPIDALLSRHFRSEMPNPWPACEALAQARKAARRHSRFRSLSRLALAASVVLFFAAYLTLAALFPPQPAKGIDDSRNIGNNPNREHKLQHPTGKRPRVPAAD